MAALPKVIASGDKIWINRHETFEQPVDNIFTIINGDTGDLVNDYIATTLAVQNLIGRAANEGKTIRALGGCWSFSDVAATDGWLVNTMGLNMLFNISVNSISTEYKGNRNQLLFSQCGNSVQELNRYLETHGKALKTSGASNGQTIAGAIATGTHGAAFDFGATQDFIVGLHIIISPGRNIWLERASYPVVSGSFITNLKTELIRDDQLFNAALVSIGSFGFIHGVMIETEEKYLLEGHRQLIPYNDSLKHIMETLDFSNAPLPHGSERPFHFQVLINQYDLKAGAFVTTMYKRAYNGNYTPPATDTNKAGPGDDAPAFIGKLTDLISVAVPLLVNTLIKGQYAPGQWTGTTGEIFTNTDTRGKVLSTAMGIPVAYVNQVNDILIHLNEQAPFPGVFAYRYVKQSKATLAFTQFEPTCVVELDGVQSDLTWNFYRAVWDELDANGIPYTFHWGKINNLNDQKVRNKYNINRDNWVKARNGLLPAESLILFSSPPLKNLGLDEIL
jgi:hypothetical protein